MYKKVAVTVLACALLLTASHATAGESKWLDAVKVDSAEDGGKLMLGEASKPLPITIGVDYTLVSDYFWRGANLSEYAGEGREDPNHQATVSFELDLKKMCNLDLGSIGGSIWFEWYAGQDQLTGGDGNLQEVDYTLYWSMPIADTGITAELGWIAYTFPQAAGAGHTTYEVYGKLSFDDSMLWKALGFDVNEPILNPYIAYYHDYDVVKGGWMEIGMSHSFVLAKHGCADMAVLKDLTVTPAFVLGIDHRYWDKALARPSTGTSIAAAVWTLEVAYDMNAGLGIPEEYGQFTLAGFLGYSNAVKDKLINDEFWGGVKFAWQW